MDTDAKLYFDTLQWLLAEHAHLHQDELHPVRVHVGLPTYGNIPAVCMLSFGLFIGNAVAAHLIYQLGEVEGAYIDRARNDLVRQAIANNSTHVMFVDQDMIIPGLSLGRLVAQDAPWVGGSYWGKDDWFTPVSFHLDPFRRIYELEDCPIVESKAQPNADGILDCWCGKPDDHLHEVGGTGMGCTLLSLKTLQEVAEYYKTHLCPCGAADCAPERWFSSKETGEDVHLAMRFAEMGIPRYLDGFVQCGHARTQIVTRQHYDWAKQQAPRCKIAGCNRAAFWDVKSEEDADTAERCWMHRGEPA